MNAEILQCRYAKGTQFDAPNGSKWTYLENDQNREFHYAVENVYGDTWVTTVAESPDRLIGLGALLPLGSSNARILTKPEDSRKKCLSMTKSMARNIRNAAYLMEQRHGKDCLSFLTLTLPDLPPDGLAACAANWDNMVHKFLKWLRTRVEARNIELEYVYCTEIQTKRLQNRGEYALHLHLLFRGKYGKKSPWSITPKQARKEWVRCIKSVCDSPFQSSAIENLQRIKRSAGGYLSKYMGKGSNCIPEASRESIGVSYRGHWGGMSRNLSRLIKQSLCVVSGCGLQGHLARAFYRGIPALLENGHIRYFSRGFIPLACNSTGGEVRGLHVGVGCLGKPTYAGGLVDCIKQLDLSGDDTIDTICKEWLDKFRDS